MEITEIMAWQAISILECALALWLMARCLRLRERLLDQHTIYSEKVVALSNIRASLREIVSLDTPKAAHGVKKAVKIATEALGQ